MQENEQPLKPTHEEIARLACAIWEHEGFPEGQDMKHWLEAEALLTKIKRSLAARTSSSAGAPKTAGASHRK